MDEKDGPVMKTDRIIKLDPAARDLLIFAYDVGLMDLSPPEVPVAQELASEGLAIVGTWPVSLEETCITMRPTDQGMTWLADNGYIE